MKEEFTTLMHADMLGWSVDDAKLIDAYAKIKSGKSKRTVCKSLDISVDYYDANIDSAKKHSLSQTNIRL